ncbi:MAG: hypothetical protein ACXAEU_20885, partial [Candidatus Hodarchaeales archaeon]
DYFKPGFREILVFKGTLRMDRHNKLARLHNQITASETGYNHKRRYLEQVGILSQWFDTAMLDKISILLEKNGDRRKSSLEEEIKKFLAYIDCFLRLEGNIIRWKTIVDINEYFNLEINKKSLFKYRVEAQKHLFDHYGRKMVLTKLRKSSILIMKRIANEFITTDAELDVQAKNSVRDSCFKVIDQFKIKRFIPRDHEIYAFAVYYMVKKGMNVDLGKYNFPVNDPKFRRSISNAIYNIRTKIFGNDPVSTVLSGNFSISNVSRYSLLTAR